MSNVAERSAIARQRLAEPVQFDGKTFQPTAVAAKHFGCNPSYLRRLSVSVPGFNMVLVTANGWFFVRLPRHSGDSRSPLYWYIGD